MSLSREQIIIDAGYEVLRELNRAQSDETADRHLKLRLKQTKISVQTMIKQAEALLAEAETKRIERAPAELPTTAKPFFHIDDIRRDLSQKVAG